MAGTEHAGIGGGAPRGRTKACTACRQVKLKCNAREVFPAPCSRCVAQSLECRMDPTFKRVPARKQLEEVTNRLMKLQRSLGLGEDFASPEQTGSGAASAGTSSSRGQRLLENRAPTSPQAPRKQSSTWGGSDSDTGAAAPLLGQEGNFLDLIEEPSAGAWRLDAVRLTYEQARELFQHFDKVMWRHVPFLEQCHSLHRLHQTSDLLFWTIVLVSSRLYNEYDELVQSLIPAHRSLLSARVFGGRASLETVHAVLLLCTWPYPVQSQTDDITWLLCGLAINLGMSIGLHKPEHGHEYTAHDNDHVLGLVIGSPYARNMTWMACFQISTSLASWLGLPPSISSSVHLETMDTLCQDERYPRAFCAKVEIQRHITRIINGLDARLDFRTRFSLIKLYEQDLERVQTTFAGAWTEEVEVDWLGAKLFLYGMAFISSDTSDVTPRETHDRAAGAREMLQHGLATSSRLLATLAHLPVAPVAAGENRVGCSDFVFQLSFLPKHVFRVMAFASFFLMWYLAVEVQASESDKELATRHIALCYKLLGAVRHSEEHLRAATSIEMMARFGAISHEHNVHAAYLLVNSRLGASFMYSLRYRECSPHRHLLAPPQEPRLDSTSSDGTPPTADATDGSIDGGALPDLDRPQTPAAQQKAAPQADPNRQSAGVDPANIFSNAFFQGSGPSQNFDFLWQQWDPAVFDDLRMDVDDGQLDGLGFDRPDI